MGNVAAARSWQVLPAVAADAGAVQVDVDAAVGTLSGDGYGRLEEETGAPLWILILAFCRILS